MLLPSGGVAPDNAALGFPSGSLMEETARSSRIGSGISLELGDPRLRIRCHPTAANTITATVQVAIFLAPTQ
jgi:hypothetical protein